MAGGADRAIVKEFTVAASTDLKLKFVPRKGATLLCGVEVVAGGEMPTAQSVVHTELTVPESMVSLKSPAEEARPPVEESVSLRSFLWVAAGALGFLYLAYRLSVLMRRTA